MWVKKSSLKAGFTDKEIWGIWSLSISGTGKAWSRSWFPRTRLSFSTEPRVSGWKTSWPSKALSKNEIPSRKTLIYLRARSRSSPVILQSWAQPKFHRSWSPTRPRLQRNYASNTDTSTWGGLHCSGTSNSDTMRLSVSGTTWVKTASWR